MPLKNFYTATDVEPGDMFLVVLKCMVQHNGSYRIYRCPYDFAQQYIPEGDRIANSEFFDKHDSEDNIEPMSSEQIVAETIFPILGWCSNKPDMT